MIPSAVFGSEAWLSKLPADLRRTVLETARGLEKRATEIALDYGARAEKLWRDNGAEIIRLSPADQKLFMARVRPLGERFLGGNPRTRAMWGLLKAAAERHRR